MMIKEVSEKMRRDITPLEMKVLRLKMQGVPDWKIRQECKVSEYWLRDFKRRAGLIKPIKRVDRAQVLDLYRKGYGLYRIASKLGIGYRRVRRILVESGVSEESFSRRIPNNVLEEARRLYEEQGLGMYKISAILGISTVTLYKYRNMRNWCRKIQKTSHEDNALTIVLTRDEAFNVIQEISELKVKDGTAVVKLMKKIASALEKKKFT